MYKLAAHNFISVLGDSQGYDIVTLGSLVAVPERGGRGPLRFNGEKTTTPSREVFECGHWSSKPVKVGLVELFAVVNMIIIAGCQTLLQEAREIYCDIIVGER